jgi:hypothetical protein
MTIPISDLGRDWAVNAARELHLAASDLLSAVASSDCSVSVSHLNNAQGRLTKATESVISAKLMAEKK